MSLDPTISPDNQSNMSPSTREVTRCNNADCRRFLWKDPNSNGKLPQCELCLRHELIMQKLEEQISSQEKEISPHTPSGTMSGRAASPSSSMRNPLPVQVDALKHAMAHENKIQWDDCENEIKTHKANLIKYQSKEYLEANPAADCFETALLVRHHQLCLNLLELHEHNNKVFQVKHLDHVLGTFHGTLPDLEMLLKKVLHQVTKMVYKPSASEGQKMQGNVLRIMSESKRKVPEEVPLVSVCVQGGQGTIGTVFQAATNGTACLLVKVIYLHSCT